MSIHIKQSGEDSSYAICTLVKDVKRGVYNMHTTRKSPCQHVSMLACQLGMDRKRKKKHK